MIEVLGGLGRVSVYPKPAETESAGRKHHRQKAPPEEARAIRYCRFRAPWYSQMRRHAGLTDACIYDRVGESDCTNRPGAPSNPEKMATIPALQESKLRLQHQADAELRHEDRDHQQRQQQQQMKQQIAHIGRDYRPGVGRQQPELRRQKVAVGPQVRDFVWLIAPVQGIAQACLHARQTLRMTMRPGRQPASDITAAGDGREKLKPIEQAPLREPLNDTQPERRTPYATAGEAEGPAAFAMQQCAGSLRERESSLVECGLCLLEIIRARTLLSLQLVQLGAPILDGLFVRFQFIRRLLSSGVGRHLPFVSEVVRFLPESGNFFDGIVRRHGIAPLSRTDGMRSDQ